MLRWRFKKKIKSILIVFKEKSQVSKNLSLKIQRFLKAKKIQAEILKKF